MDISDLESIAVQVPRPVNTTRAEVDFSSGILQESAATYAATLNRISEYRMNITFTEAELQRYCNFLLRERVNQTNGKSSGKRVRLFFVPALYALALRHLGTVFDKESGVKLIPTINEDEMDIMSFEEAQAFSDKLGYVEDLGFELVVGLPKETSGDVNFMFFHMGENEILRRVKDAHPSYAILVSFFRMKQLESTFDFRITYGLAEEYQEMLRGLIRDQARAGRLS